MAKVESIQSKKSKVSWVNTIGVKNYAIILTINGFFFTGGSLFMEFLINLCASSTKTITIGFVLAFMLFHVYWLLIPEGPESFLHYLIIFCMLEFLRGGPTSRITGEISNSVGNNPFKKSVVFNFLLLLKEALSALVLYIDGHFMQISRSR